MRRFRTLKVPAHCHPLVRLMTEEQNQQQIGDHDLADRTGLSREAFKQWRSRRNPAVHNLDAALNVLGFQLVARRVRRD